MAFARKINGKWWLELSDGDARLLNVAESERFVFSSGPKGIIWTEKLEANATSSTSFIKPAVTPTTSLPIKVPTPPTVTTNLPPKTASHFLVSKTGFWCTKLEQKAREMSDQMSVLFREKKVRGLKDFDGSFYVFDENAYRLYMDQAVTLLKEKKKVKVDELAASFNWEVDLARGLCCFLKEEGIILEKSKGIYQYIE